MFKTILLIAFFLGFLALAISCRPMLKRKPKCDMCAEIIVFVQPGCAPCIEAKYELRHAGINAIYIDISTHKRLARQWGVMSVPAFFIDFPSGKVRVNSVSEILQRRCRTNGRSL